MTAAAVKADDLLHGAEAMALVRAHTDAVLEDLLFGRRVCPDCAVVSMLSTTMIMYVASGVSREVLHRAIEEAMRSVTALTQDDVDQLRADYAALNATGIVQH